LTAAVGPQARFPIIQVIGQRPLAVFLETVTHADLAQLGLANEVREHLLGNRLVRGEGNAMPLAVRVLELAVPFLAPKTYLVSILRQRGGHGLAVRVLVSGVRLAAVGDDLRTGGKRSGVMGLDESSHRVPSGSCGPRAAVLR